ncbi:hypothetical protein GF366_05005 [Candidatus Peregrinibacteria bacterium]|nr:hypothetical protein [Candidatus Peregrinibacteria bacterium]
MSERKEKGFSLEEVIFALVLENPGLFKILNENNVKEDMLGDEMKDIYNALSKQYNSARSKEEKWDFDEGFLRNVKRKINILLLYCEEGYSQFSEEALEIEIEKLVDKLKEKYKNQRLNKIYNEIMEAEKNSEKERLKKLLKEQQRLLSTDI